MHGNKLRAFENSKLNAYLAEYDRLEMEVQDLEHFNEHSEPVREALQKLKDELREVQDLIEEIEDRLPAIAPTRFDVQEFINQDLRTEKTGE